MSFCAWGKVCSVHTMIGVPASIASASCWLFGTDESPSMVHAEVRDRLLDASPGARAGVERQSTRRRFEEQMRGLDRRSSVGGRSGLKLDAECP
jgi:hypothetical protein